MNAATLHQAVAIESVSRALAEWIVERHLERDPGLEARYADPGGRMWRADVQVRIAQLAQAVCVGRVELFVDSVAWSKIAFRARDVALDDLRTSLACTAEVLAEQLPAEIADHAVSFVEAALERLDSMPEEIASHVESDTWAAELSRRYLEAILEHDRDRAGDLLERAFGDGRSLSHLYLDVIRPALAEIGRMWHMGEITVADEHYATAATQTVMSRLFDRARRAAPPTPVGRTAVVASVGGDLHEIGPRMVAEFLELGGWKVVFLGANTPADEIISAAIDCGADLVCVAAGTSLAVRGVVELVERLRSVPDAAAIKVMVGGCPFAVVPDLWRQVGADGCARDAQEAVAAADRLCGVVRAA